MKQFVLPLKSYKRRGLGSIYPIYWIWFNERATRVRAKFTLKSSTMRTTSTPLLALAVLVTIFASVDAAPKRFDRRLVAVSILIDIKKLGPNCSGNQVWIFYLNHRIGGPRRTSTGIATSTEVDEGCQYWCRQGVYSMCGNRGTKPQGWPDPPWIFTCDCNCTMTYLSFLYQNVH